MVNSLLPEALCSWISTEKTLLVSQVNFCLLLLPPLNVFQIHTLLVCACTRDQLCPTLCSPTDCSPPDSSVHGLFQARTLEWVATSYSRGYSRPRDGTHISCASCTGRRVLHLLSHHRSPSNQGATQLPPALDPAQPAWCLCPGSSSRSHVTRLHIYISPASRLSSLTLPPGSLPCSPLMVVSPLTSHSPGSECKHPHLGDHTPPRLSPPPCS